MEIRADLSVDPLLTEFLEHDVLPGIGIDPPAFWTGVSEIFEKFSPRNAQLLERRQELQNLVDDWHVQHRNAKWDQSEYRTFLEAIGYLETAPAPFVIDPENVDDEIAGLAGPQLVVPILNPRFVLNAANARWGSLYDALYGTDALGDLPGERPYDPARGARVIAWAKQFLDNTVPLAKGSWADFSGGVPKLATPGQMVGSSGENLLLLHNGLHIEIVVDPSTPIGRDDPGGIADIRLEAALTTICDLEDSVAAVDAEDKVAAYRVWLGLMQGNLQETFEKGGRTVNRSLVEDRMYLGPDGEPVTLPGRSLLMVRNVGHLMTNPAVRLSDGSEAPEGILDAIVTATIALYDINGTGRFRNSRTGSIYIVKPKMHGPDEVAFANDLFDAVEDLLGLHRNTIKIGLMDEERRTSANLAACIKAVRERLVFINTGFLDRTGDEIHTSMQAGPMMRKGEMKQSDWLNAYEDRNVQIGLACGLAGRAQIGKGMWAAPDKMQAMLEEKISHPRSGASTAWVPSPTAAVLHATHYHMIDVGTRQDARKDESVASLDRLLTIPLASEPNWSAEDIRQELDNNAQSLLGYVARWVEQGIGCSKVPDIHDVGLMEDRATLRISSQHLANWLHHGIASAEDIEDSLLRMARKVDEQNAADPFYRPMANDPESSLAYQAARALVFEGTRQPSGYTEPLLHSWRRRMKGSPP